MHLRRALLLFALVLGLTALAASIAPGPRRDATSTSPTPAAAPLPTASAVTLGWAVPKSGARPRSRRVAAGAHVILTVAGRGELGQAAIPRLGRTGSVTASVPARFDLVAPPGGRYEVLFSPPSGPSTLVGTLVSAP